MSSVEAEYRSRMDALSPRERVERSMAMLKWARDLLARQVVSELGAVSEDRLKWEVALRLYRADPVCCRMIERELTDVSN